jgi:hypothetical protein
MSGKIILKSLADFNPSKCDRYDFQQIRSLAKASGVRLPQHVNRQQLCKILAKHNSSSKNNDSDSDSDSDSSSDSEESDQDASGNDDDEESDEEESGSSDDDDEEDDDESVVAKCQENVRSLTSKLIEAEQRIQKLESEMKSIASTSSKADFKQDIKEFINELQVDKMEIQNNLNETQTNNNNNTEIIDKLPFDAPVLGSLVMFNGRQFFPAENAEMKNEEKVRETIKALGFIRPFSEKEDERWTYQQGLLQFNGFVIIKRGSGEYKWAIFRGMHNGRIGDRHRFAFQCNADGTSHLLLPEAVNQQVFVYLPKMNSPTGGTHVFKHNPHTDDLSKLNFVEELDLASADPSSIFAVKNNEGIYVWCISKNEYDVADKRNFDFAEKVRNGDSNRKVWNYVRKSAPADTPPYADNTVGTFQTQ